MCLKISLPTIVALCVALLLHPCLYGQDQASVQDIQKEIEDIDLQIEFMKLKVKSSETKTTDLNKKITVKTKEVKNLKSQIDQLNEGLRETELNVEKIKIQAETLKKRITSILNRYKSRLVQLHKIKQGTLLSSMFAAKDLNSFLNRYQMVKYLLESDKEIVETLQNEQQAINSLNEEMSRKLKHLEAGKKELDSKEKKLKNETSGLNAMLSTLLLEKKMFLNKEKKLLTEKESLKKALKNLDSVVTKVIPEDIAADSVAQQDNAETQKVQGAKVMQFAWPVANNLREKVTPINEDGAEAILVALIADSEITAASKGKVLYKGSISGLGDVVILGHERGFSTVYARLDNIWVGLNEVVEKGDVIGKIAAGGRNAALHFEIRFGSKKQKPLEYLPY